MLSILLWLILILLFIIIIPLPIKLSLIYMNNNLSILLFNKPLNLKKKKKEKKTKAKPSKFTLESVKRLINKLECNPYKPKIKFNLTIDYGFDDAALTGVSYGIINALSYNLYQLIHKFFKIKDFNININPNFENKIIYLNITGIIYINIAQIIYIAILSK